MSAAQPLPASNNSNHGRIGLAPAEVSRVSGGVSMRTGAASTGARRVTEGRLDTESPAYNTLRRLPGLPFNDGHTAKNDQHRSEFPPSERLPEDQPAHAHRNHGIDVRIYGDNRHRQPVHGNDERAVSDNRAEHDKIKQSQDAAQTENDCALGHKHRYRDVNEPRRQLLYRANDDRVSLDRLAALNQRRIRPGDHAHLNNDEPDDGGALESARSRQQQHRGAAEADRHPQNGRGMQGFAAHHGFHACQPERRERYEEPCQSAGYDLLGVNGGRVADTQDNYAAAAGNPQLAASRDMRAARPGHGEQNRSGKRKPREDHECGRQRLDGDSYRQISGAPKEAHGRQRDVSARTRAVRHPVRHVSDYQQYLGSYLV